MWYSKYSPTTIEDCILPKKVKVLCDKIIADNDLNSMIFTGPAGIGKTTAAKCLAHQLNSDVLLINGSENAGIDVLRTTVRQFASNRSMSEGCYKIVIFDEADYMPSQSTQPALRGFIDEFVDTTRFIFTCNYPHKIIEALHSRCPTVNFTPDNKDKTAAKLAVKIMQMCGDNNVKVDQKALFEFCIKCFPDFRATINSCEMYAKGGAIDSGILQLGNTNVDRLVELILKKDFHGARVAVANIGSYIYQPLYEALMNAIPDQGLTVALVVSKYEHMSTFAVSQEVCLAGCISELIGELK
jgi:DNA polymerase III delta prime subunit